MAPLISAAVAIAGNIQGFETFFWALYCFFWPFCFFSVGRGGQEVEVSHGSWWQGVHGLWLQSQNAELSSLLACTSAVLASQKCLQSQGSGSGGVLVAKLRTVVAFGFACWPRISERLHMFFLGFCMFNVFFRIVFSWLLFRDWALGL